jgi:hypothetical protein
MRTGWTMSGSRLASVIVRGQAPLMLKRISFKFGAALASIRAWRSEPMPASLVLVTVSTVAVVPMLDSKAPRSGASPNQRGLPSKSPWLSRFTSMRPLLMAGDPPARRQLAAAALTNCGLAVAGGDGGRAQRAVGLDRGVGVVAQRRVDGLDVWVVELDVDAAVVPEHGVDQIKPPVVLVLIDTTHAEARACIVHERAMRHRGALEIGGERNAVSLIVGDPERTRAASADEAIEHLDFGKALHR